MPESSRLRWEYPAEYADPWYRAFVSLVEAMDASVYTTREDRSSLVMGGGTFSFTAAGLDGTLSWTGAIEWLSPLAGYLFTISAGSTPLAEGQMLYLQLVRAPIANMTLSLTLASKIPNTDDVVLFAVRRGNRVYFRNGTVLQSGQSGEVLQTWGGGGGVVFDAADPQPIGVPTPGNTGKVVHSNHVHAHGSQIGGSLHALATTLAAGFMSAADKTKLDGLDTSGFVPATRTVTGSGPILIDGDNTPHDLSANRTISVVVATPLAAGVVSTVDQAFAGRKGVVDGLNIYVDTYPPSTGVFGVESDGSDPRSVLSYSAFGPYRSLAIGGGIAPATLDTAGLYATGHDTGSFAGLTAEGDGERISLSFATAAEALVGEWTTYFKPTGILWRNHMDTLAGLDVSIRGYDAGDSAVDKVGGAISFHAGQGKGAAAGTGFAFYPSLTGVVSGGAANGEVLAFTILESAVTSSVPFTVTASHLTSLLGGARIDVGSDATGDTYYRNGTPVLARVGIGGAGTFYKSTGSAPSWANITAADVSGVVPTTTTITTTAPLRIDGGASADLSANRTLSILSATSSREGTVTTATQSFAGAKTIVVDDGATGANLDVLTLLHSTTGTATAGIGTGVLLQSEKTTGAVFDAVRLRARVDSDTTSSLYLATATAGTLTDALQIDSAGVLVPQRTTNTQDIGATGSKWKTGYFGTSVLTPVVGVDATHQHTVPNVANDTLALLAATQTLTNKTLSTGTKVTLGSDAIGDLYYNTDGATGTLGRLAAVATGSVLKSAGTGTPPAWGTLSAADVSGVVPTTRTLTGTSPIQIDGGASADLSANRTISILSASLTQAGAVSTATQVFAGLKTVQIDDAATNTVTDVFKVAHSTSGTAAAGFGTGLVWQAENASGTLKDVARVQAALTTATNAAEVATLDFWTINAGALALRWQFTGAGHLLPASALTGTLDVGSSSAQARTGYFGTSVLTPVVGVDATHQHTVPNVANDTLALLAAAQTLTNKTLSTGTKVTLGSDTIGDLYYNTDGATGTLGRLAAGTATHVLTSNGPGAAPSWQAASAGVPTSRTLTGTAPIQIDGSNAAQDLSANRTISVADAAFGTTGVVNTSTQTLGGGAKTVRVADTNTATSVTGFTVTHSISSGTPANNIGVKQLFQLPNAAGTLVDAWTINVVLEDAGVGTEKSSVDLRQIYNGSTYSNLKFGSDGVLNVANPIYVGSLVRVANNQGYYSEGSGGGGFYLLAGLTSGNLTQLGNTSFATKLQSGATITLESAATTALTATSTLVSSAVALKAAAKWGTARTVPGAYPYTSLDTDSYIAVTSTASARTINLIAAATFGAGNILEIADESGGAGTNNITIDANSTETIDGALTKVINSNYGSVRLRCTGTGWQSLGSAAAVTGVIKADGSVTWTADQPVGAHAFLFSTMSAPGTPSTDTGYLYWKNNGVSSPNRTISLCVKGPDGTEAVLWTSNTY